MVRLVEEHARRIRLRLHAGPIAGLSVHVERDGVAHMLVPGAVMRVHCRDTGRPERVTVNGPMVDLGDRWDEVEGRLRALLPRAVRDTIVMALSHEVDEGFEVGGERVFDPHEGRSRIPR